MFQWYSTTWNPPGNAHEMLRTVHLRLRRGLHTATPLGPAEQLNGGGGGGGHGWYMGDLWRFYIHISYMSLYIYICVCIYIYMIIHVYIYIYMICLFDSSLVGKKHKPWLHPSYPNSSLGFSNYQEPLGSENHGKSPVKLGWVIDG